ncbi:N/A [soil metagenome]
MSEKDVILEVKGLSKEYFRASAGGGPSQAFLALNNISFQLKQGEVLGIIGPNGSGKSTLLKMISGITKPSSGAISIRGRLASILDVGTGFHPDLSGRENVFLRGELLGMQKGTINKLFDEIVAFSGIGSFIDTPVKHYSSGMFLRLAFSIIIHLDVDILVLDEVLSVGDESFRNKCQQKINDIAKSREKTLVIVSHDLHSLYNFSPDSILILGKGQIQFHGGPEEALDKYTALVSSDMDPAKRPLPASIELGDMRIMGLDGKQVSFYLEIIAKEVPNNLTIALLVKNKFGEVLFTCSDADFFISTKLESDGVNILSCTLNENPFNEGMFYVDVIFNFHNDNEKVAVRNYLEFKAEGATISETFPSKLKGQIALRNSWAYGIKR